MKFNNNTIKMFSAAASATHPMVLRSQVTTVADPIVFANILSSKTSIWRQLVKKNRGSKFRRTHPMVLRSAKKRTHPMQLRNKMVTPVKSDETQQPTNVVQTTPRKLSFASPQSVTISPVKQTTTNVPSGAAIDAQFLAQFQMKGFTECEIVCDENDATPFDALLCFVAGTSDKFYVLQVIKYSTQGKSQFVFCTRWGRTGSTGQTQTIGPFDDAEPAIKTFEAKFMQKTANTYSSFRAGGFQRVASKYDCPCAPVAGSVKAAQAAGVNWEYLVHNDVPGWVNGWYSYDLKNAFEVEALYQAFQSKRYQQQVNSTVSSTTMTNLAQRTVFSDSSRFNYRVDLMQFKQTNMQTSKTREIRRVNPNNFVIV